MSKSKKSKKIKFHKFPNYQTELSTSNQQQMIAAPSLNPQSVESIYPYPVSLVRKDLVKSLLLSVAAFLILAFLNFYLR